MLTVIPEPKSKLNQLANRYRFKSSHTDINLVILIHTIQGTNF